MKTLSTLLTILIFPFALHSQSCLPEGIVFMTQSQIDDFQVNYPDCVKIEGDITIGDWDVASDITNLDGLSVLNALGGDFNIFYNDYLSSLAGLINLTSISGNFNIYGNSSLTSLSGLDNLNYIGGNLEIAWQGNISNLSHLNSLTSIGGNLYIDANYNLTSLAGLSSLNSIGGKLTITNNRALLSLSGLDSINSGSITELLIAANLSLSTCAVKSICDYLAGPDAIVHVEVNTSGCNSQEEIEAACAVGVDESAVGNWQLAVNIYPNPSSKIITVETPTEPDKNITLTIFSANGQALTERLITENHTVLDVSGLPPGIYLVKVISDDGVLVRKFVKE